MAAGYTTSDLVKGALQAVGELTDGTSRFHSLAHKYVNVIYKDVLSGCSEFAPEVQNAWIWARVKANFTLPPVYNAGSVTLTQNSTAGTFSSAPTISLAGYYLQQTDSFTVYQIATHAANATAFTLDGPLIETGGSGLGYNAMPLDFDLGPGIFRLVEAFRIYVDRVLEYWEDRHDRAHIYGTDINTLRTQWPMRYILNDTPSRFATITRNEDHWWIKFNKYVSNPIRVDYEYIAIPTGLPDSDDASAIPLIPLDYREILSYGAASKLCIDKRLMDLADKYAGLTKAKILAMQAAEVRNEIQTSKIYGRLVPRMDSTRPWFRYW